MSNILHYTALIPQQSQQHTVFCFCAKATDILRFAGIDRIGRQEDNSLTGFQRPQIARHIKEIRDYLAKSEAILPNSVVVAFTGGVTLENQSDGMARVSIDLSQGQNALVVDGQQRLSALAELPDKDFEVFVSALLCENEAELRKQFILINNTKPLPKALIYELLPTVDGLPQRLDSRRTAAELVELLNYTEGSPLESLLKQQTNPAGVIQDTIMQRMIMTSLSDGALREMMQAARTEQRNGLEQCFKLLSAFFEAVAKTFPEAWKEQKPKTSRLVHGAGIVGMGYVMDYLFTTQNTQTVAEFQTSLQALKGKTAWTAGVWDFGPDNQRPWNSLQNVPKDYLVLSQYLVQVVKRGN
ncbi:DGQHR domain-containing protein DpdB [Candidatus Venteria ishoeyi]|uniref:DGQHR domain protein n=1 Tax=Candidatus Venteria ishoeyi TaxID=1899563 RepID=A0A1H6FAU2_9GAMM|nr:DGQHR domain-containing protein DpdB [Candidatus Venteria ishoeyi]SEH06429.1 Uncharacterised protein [Candidatus Venteria ishoeyi]